MVLFGQDRGLEIPSGGADSGEEGLSPSPFDLSSNIARTFGISLPAVPRESEAVAEGTGRLVPFLEDLFFGRIISLPDSERFRFGDVAGTLSSGDFKISVILRFPNLDRVEEDEDDDNASAVCVGDVGEELRTFDGEVGEEEREGVDVAESN
jgi:hypothetical protein